MFGLAVLTVSTSGFYGQREDTSGEAIKEVLAPPEYNTVRYEVVSDEQETIAQRMVEWADDPDAAIDFIKYSLSDGYEATLAIAKKLEGVDFLPSLYSHPIGYHGHALGPSINARNMDTSTLPGRDSILRAGSYRSVEFSATTAVPEYGGGTVTIPMEDDAYLTTDGYIYFRPYQTEWYVIR